MDLEERVEALGLVDLMAGEVKRLLRPRAGFRAFVRPLLALYEANREWLGVHGIDVDETLRELARHDELLQAEAEARRHLAMLKKTRMLCASTVWRTMLTIYARAQVAARGNRLIAVAIEPFARFMRHGPRVKATAPETTSR